MASPADGEINTRNANIVEGPVSSMLDAKCPQCAKKAQVNDEMTEVECRHCGFRSRYDDYLEIMKSKAVNFAEEFHSSSDKRPF